MTYLLDTCIISKLRKIAKSKDKMLQEWVMKHAEEQYFLSVLTIGEIQQGISKLVDVKQRRILEDWLNGGILVRFEGRILPVDFRVALKWGDLSGASLKKGSPQPVIDGLIASTAIANDLILVTENIKDFVRIEGLKMFNPWEK
jgi:predicted nucleic acid-binding protein